MPCASPYWFAYIYSNSLPGNSSLAHSTSLSCSAVHSFFSFTSLQPGVVFCNNILVIFRLFLLVMIAGVSKAVTLYLSPILALTSLFLIMFAYLAPTVLLHDRVALLIVSPSTTLTTNSTTSQNIDGPTVFLGALGTTLPSHLVLLLLTLP